MPGGLHAPIEQWVAWPGPNYVDPHTKPKYVLITACILGPICLPTFVARLWVRLRIQKNPGWDDFLMLLAWPFMTAMTIVYPLVVEKYMFNRHVWDVPMNRAVIQRQYVMAIYILFAVTSGLIKASILLFYRRLSPRSVSPTFRWILRLSIAFIGLSTLGFIFVTIFECEPVSAFWNQVDLILNASGKYKFKCLDEGAAIVANGAISAFQDVIAATLPAVLCWKLPLNPKQKKALYIIFAFSYLAVAFGCMRTYYSHILFFETYDVTWVAGDIWLWSLLELNIGCICANAPAVKVLYRHYFAASSPEPLADTASNPWDKMSFWKRVTSQRSRANTSESHSSQMHITANSEEDKGDVEMGHIQTTTKFSFVVTPAQERKDPVVDS